MPLVPVLEGMRLTGSGHGGDQAPHSLAVPWRVMLPPWLLFAASSAFFNDKTRLLLESSEKHLKLLL